MNYAHFAEYVKAIHAELRQRFDIDPDSCSAIMERFELDCVQAAIQQQAKRRLIRDYLELGPVALAERMGVSRETVRQKYHAAHAQLSPGKLGT